MVRAKVGSATRAFLPGTRARHRHSCGPACVATMRRNNGVLLYYSYCDIASGRTQADVHQFYVDNCAQHQLKGRIRVAEDGVNVTVGGAWAALEAHIEAVRHHPVLGANDIDFKLAESGALGLGGALMQETGFDTLSVRLCKELVTLGPLARGRADPRRHAGRHLTPEEFHGVLLRASACAAGGTGAAAAGEAGKETVLVDARNIYETRIGHFDVHGLQLLDPTTRCFSDLPAWLDRNGERLRGRRVLMYCTGGVRCERASAFLREKGAGFEDVYQLKGGIQRYLEAFRDGGFFKGKNFVYDERMSVGPRAPPQPASISAGAAAEEASSTAAEGREALDVTTGPGPASSAAVVGRCLLCERGWDDYSGRVRCARCRMLLLVCEPCQQQQQLHTDRARGGKLLCEICQARQHKAPDDALPGSGAKGQQAGPASAAAAAAAAAAPAPSSRRAGSVRLPEGGCAAVGGRPSSVDAAPGQPSRLRILCLHGFRQTGYKLMGRTCGLRKHLDDLADFFFPDAPHLLPHFVKLKSAAACAADDGEAGDGGQATPEGSIEPLQELTMPEQLPTPASHKRAWLVAPELLMKQYVTEPGAPAWQLAPEFVDEGQYTMQTAGWQASWQALSAFIERHGPFDGVLGFSQGSAVATVLCALQQEQGQQQQQQQQGQQVAGSGASVQLGFRFAILASGFRSACPEHAALVSRVGPLQLPSLHVFGGGINRSQDAASASCPAVAAATTCQGDAEAGCSAARQLEGSARCGSSDAVGPDRQISAAESEELVAAFDPSCCRLVVRHGQGHILPSKKLVTQAVRSFLLDQLGRDRVLQEGPRATEIPY